MGEFVPKFERKLESKPLGPRPLSTAGAIPVKDDKGRIIMKKVKVQRYMAGKIPEFAHETDSEDEREDEIATNKLKSIFVSKQETEFDEDQTKFELEEEEFDREEMLRKQRRLKRRREEEQELMARQKKQDESDDDEESTEQIKPTTFHSKNDRIAQIKLEKDQTKLELEDEELNEEEMLRKRELIRLRRKREEEQELLAKQKEAEEISEEESEEETSDEEEESEDEIAPRLKPVFVPKNDRITLIELEKEQAKLEQIRVEEEQRKMEKKKQTTKIIEDQLKREAELEKARKEEGAQLDLTAVNTEDENEEIAYETWKVREMKRLKRNRDEREALAREKEELDRIHSMTEEERREYMRLHPKLITNEQKKGKYKFLQKYYHRGVFFLDKEDEVLTRNFAEATGEDVFDKSVLPKVMQVKNFGKASRTKWTHLTAEDTTDHQGVWATPTPLSMKFVTKHFGGMKSVFERPTAKKRKMVAD